MCCKSTTEEGLVYKDEDFKNFYNMDTPTVAKQENSVLRDQNTIAKSAAFSASTIVNDDGTIGSDYLEKSKNLFKATNKIGEGTSANLDVVDQKLLPIQATSQSQYLSGSKQNVENQVLPTLISSKILKLTIKECKIKACQGDELIINCKGLLRSLRQTQGQDGHVFFGHKSDDIDYYLSPEEGIQSKHLEIKYDQKSDEYLANNIKGSGVFIKIEKPLELRDGLIISFGTNHILVNISSRTEEQKYSISVIKFKAIYGANKGKD